MRPQFHCHTLRSSEFPFGGLRITGGLGHPESPMRTHIANYEEKSFYTLLIDAIGLAQEAARHDHARAQRMFARACILDCALLVECAANICTSSRSLSIAGTPIEKLAEYGKHAHGRELDLARPEVLAVEELRRMRNQYVHVRVRQHAVTVPTEDLESWGEVHSEASPVLHLSVMPAMWSLSDATKTLRAVEQFFRYFFVELLGQSPKQLFELLATALYLAGGGNGRMEDSMLDRAIAVAVSDWSIDFAFLGCQSDG